MKSKSTYFLVVATIFISISKTQSVEELNLLPPDRSYNILVLVPLSSISHRNCFLPLAEALGTRGHQVTILSPLPPGCKHPNVREYNHGIDILKGMKTLFEIREQDPSGGFAAFKEINVKLMRGLYNNTIVLDLYKQRSEFDLIIIDEMFNEVAYPFLEGKKYIAIGTSGHNPTSSAILGNVLNPSYVLFTQNLPRPLSFINRVYNLFWHIFLPLYWRHLHVMPAVQEVATEMFPNLPPLLEIERDGLALVFSNSHFSYDYAIPLLPSQIEVGGMHCRPGKKLPQELKTWIDDAGNDGVIYFSLGSVANGTTMPQRYKDIFVEAFGKLKQKVIWKFEDDMPNLPKNVIIRNWMPQQDILSHPKVKLFITHGGLLSSQEAIYHATPMLALPIFGDQPKNAARIKSNNFGTYLIWEKLSVNIVIEAIQEVISNPLYQKTISSVSASFRDQPAKPLETAVWWTEYVIRHQGAPQLRSPAADLSWIEYLMIDVIIAIHIFILAFYFFLKKLIKMLYRFAFGTKSTTKKKKKD